MSMVVPGALHLEPTDTLNLSGLVAARQARPFSWWRRCAASRRLKLAVLQISFHRVHAAADGFAHLVFGQGHGLGFVHHLGHQGLGLEPILVKVRI